MKSEQWLRGPQISIYLYRQYRLISNGFNNDYCFIWYFYKLEVLRYMFFSISRWVGYFWKQVEYDFNDLCCVLLISLCNEQLITDWFPVGYKSQYDHGFGVNCLILVMSSAFMGLICNFCQIPQYYVYITCVLRWIESMHSVPWMNQYL